MNPLNKIACIGEVMIELVTQADGHTDLNIAGDTYNTAVYLAHLLAETDSQVSYVTALGQDRFSKRVLSDMEQHGIMADYVEIRDDKVIGLYAIDTDANGERSFTYWRSDSAARTLFSEPAQIGLDQLMGFDLIFLSGITLAILPEGTRQALFDLLDQFRLAGGLVAYDSNHRPQLWNTIDQARAVNAQMWARTDIGLPSVDDEMAIFGETDEISVLSRLRTAGLQQGALKQGATGPVALSPDVAPQSWPPVQSVIDTTAAGDSFNAGFLAGIATGTGPEKAMELGHALASEVIQHRGAIVPWQNISTRTGR
ncbi:sugar kinase [Phaeobacter marinintestinus]|uniref:sugar kinase n=1 Tax=Falsiphaeobacter marinintestinus TaxID=1492905 RepID=UPI0011B38242|nr:sugar kinase [Phaeobacter marinintestinus]